ncbi:unnamed protein product, partial [Coregonus sp. 'balchen']
MSLVQRCSCGRGSSCPSRARQTEPQMDLIHSSGVLVIQHLQSNYKDYHDILDFMSSVGDPRNIFSLYFPLWFQLSQIVGTKMIWVAVIGDWFNLIFKCPSGHAMGSSCVWYVMITSALNFTRRLCDSSTQGCQRFGLVWSFLWTAFWIIQISVGISRIFIATHFPHQVILGVLAGILVAEAFEHVPSIHTASLKVYLQTSFFLFSFAVSLYFLLKMIDIDLLWSIPKAKKWCANPDWIHLDTTPFAGLVRNLGALFGLGLAINSQMFIHSCKGKNGYKTRFKLMCVAANLTSLQLYDFIKIPTHTEILFYTLSFCKSAAVPLSVVALIPYCVHLLIGDKERKLD